MRQTTRRWVLAVGGTVTVGVVVAGVLVLWPPTGRTAAPRAGATTTSGPPALTATETAQRFLTALTGGDPTTAADLTDSTAAAASVLARTREQTRTVPVTAQLGSAPQLPADAATAALPVTFTWQPRGTAPWTYPSTLTLNRADDRWRVHWTSQLLNPGLADGQALGFASETGAGALTYRDGTPVGPDGAAPLVLPAARQAAGNLAGTDGWKFVALDAAGNTVGTLHEQAPQPGPTVAVTLDPAVQTAAQNALAGVSQPAMLVALQPSTGEVLAVARNTAADSSGASPYSGLYPPGSTFKIVTAAAALQAGAATPDTDVPCPGAIAVGQRTISNDNHFDLGTVPLHQAFARSCNTSFASLAGQLPPDALPAAARQLGLGVDFTMPGADTVTGSVPAPGDGAEQVEDAIGQGRVQATVFGMTLVAASIAAGHVPTPVLLRGRDTHVTGPAGALPPGITGPIRDMMREVVTAGTASSLAGLPDVHGKTGTAQFGDGTQSHAWFVGFRGDLAFGVLVVGGGESTIAVNTTATFLTALG